MRIYCFEVSVLIPCVRQPIWFAVMTTILTAQTAMIKRSLKTLLGRWKLSAHFSSTENRAIEDVFRRIWADNYWGNAESRSGGGSSLTQTAALRVSLATMLQELKISSRLDLPCGDFHWMKEVAFCPEMTYVGGDIVDELTELKPRCARVSGESRIVRSIWPISASDIGSAGLGLARQKLNTRAGS